MKIAGVIPARYASTRFPGKPLADIGGKSMIQRVYEQAIQCAELDAIIVATDDNRIIAEVESFGGQVMLTDELHRNGTERCAEVAEKLDSSFEAIINIQGDEPFIDPAQISLVAEVLNEHPNDIATLIMPLSPELTDEASIVKAVTSNSGRALYFSRHGIPYLRDQSPNTKPQHYKHIGIYGYSITTLYKLVSLPPSDLEIAESLEQLRWLEHDFNIYTSVTDKESLSVDTQEDLVKINEWLKTTGNI